MKKVLDRNLILVIFLLFFQVGLTNLFVRFFTYSDLKTTLQKNTERIKNLLIYKNESGWDTNHYDADPQTPHPSGSSGYSNPLYILTTDGYVIERNNPIEGFLDVSDYKKLLIYKEPETIDTVINKKYRVLSTPVYEDKEVEGVLLVAYYNPDLNNLNYIDQLLIENLQIIYNQIKVKNKKIDASLIDIKTINYNVSFEVVNKYNIVLANNGRVPTFIDPSYITKELSKNNKTRIIKSNKEDYFIYTASITKNKEPIGIVVIGESLKNLYRIFNLYLFLSFLINTFIILPIYIFMIKLNNPTIRYPKSISFSKASGDLLLDNIKITIPFASNQYYLLLTLLEKPKKRFELDELLEKLGEDTEKDNWRKVYDSKIAINKKLPFRLILHKDKTFFIEPAVSEKTVILK